MKGEGHVPTSSNEDAVTERERREEEERERDIERERETPASKNRRISR